MVMLYVLSASTVLIIAALVIVFLLYRTVDLLERIAAARSGLIFPTELFRRPDAG